MRKKIKYLPLVIAFALTGCGGSDSNNAPEFTSNLTFTLDEDSSISGQVVATDDNAVSYTLGSASSNGLFALNADGTFTYTPKENFAGQDTVTVTATDGNLSTDAVLTFTVNNVNDAPTLTSQSVTVTTSSTTEGTLTFNDVDGDTVTVSLVTPPANGTLNLDEQTGAFTFTADTLSEINDSFVIEFTDGNISSPISATIELKPSYVTNEDKLNYYYSSDKSHLKQAEAVSENINDDIYMDEVNTQLAVGYIAAGFEEQAEQNFSAISALDKLARAYRDAGEKLDSLFLSDRAAEYRLKSEAAYNQYVAEKGLENINSSEPSFYLGLINDYNEAKQVTQASDLLDILNLYANTVREEEYNKPYGRFLTPFKNASEAAIEAYVEDRTDSNRANALQIIRAYGELSVKTGYEIQRSGAFKDQRVEKRKALNISWATELLLSVNEVELAKDYTNLVLSLYGVTGFDANYPYESSPYSEATLNTYTYPLVSLSASIKALYGVNAENNPAFSLLTSDKNKTNAREFMFAYEIADNLTAGFSMADAVTTAKAYFLEGEEVEAKSFYDSLVGGSSAPGAAMILQSRDEDELAIEVLNYAATVLYSEDYILNERVAQIVGFQGCAALVRFDLLLGATEQAKKHADECAIAVNNYIASNNGNFETTSSIEAYSNLINVYESVINYDAIPTVVTKLDSEIKLLESKESQIKYRLKNLGYLIAANQVDTALSWLENSLAELETEKVNMEIDDFTDMLETVFNTTINDQESTTGFFAQDSVLTALAKHHTSDEGYAANYEKVISLVKQFTDKATTFINLQPDKVVQDNMETLVSTYTFLGEYEAVLELINLNLNGDADKQALFTLYASIVARRDDFPASSIASIDTDHDGKPNFFLSGASEQAIADSGLIADNDADNDGIEDSIDLTPLGE
ncbi:hypothetical protein NCCP2140_26170 [Pseudoalteromonas sp. NCCP-2140]|uniref:cadherin-like domain-containing protein n=1 Tax=Pseudoalteromonas sp. NCCP-2140 TaxID=2942288 RepID=UPI00203E8472|nr:cadherin-like domain-containing protein [Pseudoalteromonas sp. NCCP-2140]GKW53564.1 hypothetical protein NCCP2140_26170 [Pseudoalteromonas sp. NCCP-2140]